ncbi:MAG: DUF262 domain-containing protein [Deltaproteobacteria bacterium]|nr:DUF262 domain-containing protein [Deltaproteobacteria bacterium]
MSTGDEQASKAPRMRTAAEAASMTVERVIKLASEGRLCMPSFQRPLRWEASDRRELLDSIYRGYPVGTLLLWKNAPTGSAGRPLNASAPEQVQGERYLVVDGQQRLTTLWDALGRKPAPREGALVFDMANEKFLSRPLSREELDAAPPALEDGALPEVPVYLLLDAASLSEWVPHAMPREQKRLYFELGKRIREYTLGFYVVADAEIDALRHVFDRINTSGKSMRREEVFDALIGSRVTEDGIAGLALVNARLSDLDFGRIDPSTILKVLEAVRGTRIGRLDPRRLDVAAAESDLHRTATALRAAISFLRNDAHVPHVEVCPYELPLVVLARFFDKHPSPSERNRILLRRWFWRGSIGERLGGASATLQQHVDDAGENDEDQSIRALLRRTGSPRELDLAWDVTQDVGLNAARGVMFLCALLDGRPRDLETGEQLAVTELFDRGRTELLRPIVRGARVGVVNKLLTRSGKNARELILDCADEAALFSHGIDGGAREALRRSDVDEFFARRSAVLNPRLRAFFERHTEVERDDAPSLSSMTRRSA